VVQDRSCGEVNGFVELRRGDLGIEPLRLDNRETLRLLYYTS
jgi:hypothetical protein